MFKLIRLVSPMCIKKPLKTRFKNSPFQSVIMIDSSILDLPGEVSKCLNIKYLSPYTQPNTKVQGSIMNFHPIVSLPVFSYYYNKEIAAHFMIKTGYPISFLEEKAFRSVFGNYEKAERVDFKTKIWGVETRVLKAEGNPRNINVIGKDFLRNGGIML